MRVGDYITVHDYDGEGGCNQWSGVIVSVDDARVLIRPADDVTERGAFVEVRRNYPWLHEACEGFGLRVHIISNL